MHPAALANACLFELELKTDLEVAPRSGVPLLRIIACGIRAKGGADVRVELVKDVVHSGKEGGFFGELVVGNQIPYPVISVVAHFIVVFVAIAVHDAATGQIGVELVCLIAYVDIECAFRDHAIVVDVIGFCGCWTMDKCVSDTGVPVLAEFFIEIEAEAIDIGFASVNWFVRSVGTK